MSVYYYLVCDEHKQYNAAASKIASGNVVPLSGFSALSRFCFDHRDCQLRVTHEDDDIYDNYDEAYGGPDDDIIERIVTETKVGSSHQTGKPDSRPYKFRCGCCKGAVRTAEHLIPCEGCNTPTCRSCRLCVADGLHDWDGKDWWVHHAVVCARCWPEYQSPAIRYRALSEGPPLTQEMIDALERERNER